MLTVGPGCATYSLEAKRRPIHDWRLLYAYAVLAELLFRRFMI
jgi:hypothetical protein